MVESVAQKKSGFKTLIKVIGIITFIGVLVAVARIVIRVFREERTDSPDSHSGV
jgi:hypothetical protein